VVPHEEIVTINVNGQPLVRITCLPSMLEELALGFAYNERLIDGMDEVAVVELCGSGRCVDVWLEHDVSIPRFRTITSGCSGGTTFDALVRDQYRVESDLHVSPEEVLHLLRQLSQSVTIYRQSGGLHGSALATKDAILFVAEDIGRHNTLDKIAGLCLREQCSCHECLLLTAGRISSEMVSKAARMGVPVLVSRTSPTSLAIELAQAWNITLIGYARRASLRVYTHEWRLASGALSP